MNIDLTDDEKTLLRGSLNGLRAQLAPHGVHAFVLLVDKITAVAVRASPEEANAFRDNLPSA